MGAASLHTVLPFPYPYKSMVAFESDIDRTSLPGFRQTQRYLSTHADTPLGRGLGLDFANSFWCYRVERGRRNDDASDEVGYWAGFEDPSPTPHANELIRYAKAGRIGVLHSFGRFDDRFVRDHAARALDMLQREGVNFRLWTNHGRYHGQNIATTLSPHDQMLGGRPGADAYHADLLRDYGVRYLWPTGYRGRSEGTKTPLYLTELEDGSKVWQFVRSSVLFMDVSHFDLFARKGALFGGNNRWPGAVGWQPQLLGLWLSEARLNRLVDQGLYCIFAQHFGNQLGAVHFAPDTAVGLRRLKSFQDRGKILVASTERLLDYNLAVTHADIATTATADHIVIDIPKIDDPAYGAFTPSLKALSGLSIAIENGDTSALPVRLIVGGQEVPPSNYRVIEESGQRIVALPWHAADTTDYAAEFDQAPLQHYRRLDPSPAANDVAFSPEDMTFAANEAGFASRNSACVIGHEADAWAAALSVLDTPARVVPAEAFTAAARAGGDASKALLADALPTVAVLGLPVAGIGLAAALSGIRHAARPSCPRLIHIRTVAGALQRIATALREGDITTAASITAETAASEARRLGPHDPASGPLLPLDRAEAERALVWADLAYYGDLPPRSGDADTLGVRDYALMAAPPAYGSAQNLNALCRRHMDFGDGFDQIRRHLDLMAELFGGAWAVERTPPKAPDALGKAHDLRQACHGAKSPNANALEELGSRATDLADRLLIVRTHGMAMNISDARRFLETDSVSAEGAALTGWLHLQAGEAAAARAAFEMAVDWAPDALGALVGLLAASVANDGSAAIKAMVPMIDRSLASAERASVAERIGFSRPTSRPRDELI